MGYVNITATSDTLCLHVYLLPSIHQSGKHITVTAIQTIKWSHAQQQQCKHTLHIYFLIQTISIQSYCIHKKHTIDSHSNVRSVLSQLCSSPSINPVHQSHQVCRNTLMSCTPPNDAGCTMSSLPTCRRPTA